MEFEKLLELRRSVRAYREERVDEDDIRKIIKCAQETASWKNSQTGRYYVSLSDEAINEVFEDLPDFNKNSSKNASYIVATFKKGISGYGSEEADLWGAYDLGLQNAYLMLKASELGYDTLVMGLRDEKKIREYFNIPEDEIMLPVIAIGKRSKDPNKPVRKELDEILVIK